MDATWNWMRRIGGFAIVGGTSTLIYATLAWYAATKLALPMPLASPVAYAFAAIWSFLGHRAMTFRDTHPNPRARARFVILALSGYGIAFVVPALVDSYLGGSATSSIVLTCVAIPLANYVFLSRYVFSERGSS